MQQYVIGKGSDVPKSEFVCTQACTGDIVYCMIHRIRDGLEKKSYFTLVDAYWRRYMALSRNYFTLVGMISFWKETFAEWDELPGSTLAGCQKLIIATVCHFRLVR